MFYLTAKIISTPSLPSTIDVLLSNSNLPFSNLETYPNVLQSDHVPIICNIYGNVQDSHAKIALYHKANWSQIGRRVKRQIMSHNLLVVQVNYDNIELYLNQIMVIFRDAGDQIPVGEQKGWQRRLSDATLRLIKERRKYQRKLKKCSDNLTRQSFIAIIGQLALLIDHHLTKDRNVQWGTFL